MAQLVRAPPCHGGGRGFESHSGRLTDYSVFGIIAQLGEHLPYKQRVIGSSPIGPILRREIVAEFQIVQSQNVTRAPRDAHSSNELAQKLECRSGGTGRRTGLKILRDLYSRTGSIPVCGIS